jgi:dolichyl-phosphate beta-glucosyltransferase
MGPKLSLVIPAYNEARRIASSLEQVLDYVTTSGMACELILVVERSTDGTAEIARRILEATPALLIENATHRGKGYAVKTGMLRATGDFVLFMDLDLSTPLAEIPVFLRRAEEMPGVDIWIGNRRHAQTEIVQRQSLVRQSMGRVFNVFVRRFVLPGLADTQCGFKLFRRHAVKPLFERQTLDGFSFDVEILLIAERLGLEVRDLPVKWKNSPETKVRVVRDSIKMLADLMLIRRRVARSFRDSANPSAGTQDRTG